MGDQGSHSACKVEIDQMKAAEKKIWEKHSIYKLPALVTDLNPNAYKPRVIRFGPYRYGDPTWEPMEAHKSRVLLRFLKRSGKSMDQCIRALNDVAKDLMDTYDSLDPKWGKDPKAFLDLIMIRDGCFMLEILRYYNAERRDEYAENDPIFSNRGMMYMMPNIRRDMMMLENQLPILLLTNFLSLEHDQRASQENKDEYLNKLAVKFCSPTTRYDKLSKKCQDKLKTCKHILDVYRKILIFANDDGAAAPKRAANTSPGGIGNIPPSAAQLLEAGIKIKRSNAAATVGSIVKDLSFRCGSCGGIFGGNVLSLPKIEVDDTMEPVFLNLVAFERFHHETGNEVTSYLAFMSNIVKTPKDANILQASKVVNNGLGTDEAVAKLFNSVLLNDIRVDPQSRLFDVLTKVNTCRRRQNIL